MAKPTLAQLRLFPSFLLVAAASTVVLAKKPGGDPPPPTPPIKYKIVWLGDITTGTNALGGSITHVYDVNTFGSVVGFANDEFGNRRAFVYDHFTNPPEFVDLNTRVELPDGWTLTQAHRINNVGRIAGLLVDANGVQRVFACDYFADPPVVHDLSIASRFLDLSEQGDGLGNGTIVGAFRESDEWHGFVWTPGEEPVILPGQRPGAMNRLGDILVSVEIKNKTKLYRRSLFTGEERLILDRYGDSNSFRINDTRVVAGRLVFGGQRTPAHYTDEEGWTLLAPNEDGTAGGALANQGGYINSQDQICGWVYRYQSNANGDYFRSGFVYDTTDGFWLLDELVSGSQQDLDFWSRGQNEPYISSGTVACAISDADQTGYGMVAGDNLYNDLRENGLPNSRMGFLLVPQPTTAQP